MYVFAIALLVTLLDQGSKVWIRQCMELHESIPVLPGFFHITYILNKGAAFGILENQRWVFLAIALLLFVLYGLFRKKLPQNGWVYSGAGLLMGGALGNALDRFLRGAVTDFFDYPNTPHKKEAEKAIDAGLAML